MAAAVPLKQQSLNPLTRQLESCPDEKAIKSLKQACINKIRRRITILRFPKIKELIDYTDVKKIVETLSFSNFYINQDEVTDANYSQKIFPAKCRFDHINVNICLHDSEKDATDQPFLMALFKVNDVVVGVYEKRDTIQGVIEEYREKGLPVPEKLIWVYMSQLCQVMENSAIDTKLEPRSLCFYRKVIFFNSQSVKSYEEGNVPVYDAPEIVMRQPASRASMVWSLGCILYEMVMLKPAYVNKEIGANTMLLMDMMKARGHWDWGINTNSRIQQGIYKEYFELKGDHESLPEEDDDNYSEELLDFISDCMSKDEDDRPTVAEVRETTLDKMFVL